MRLAKALVVICGAVLLASCENRKKSLDVFGTPVPNPPTVLTAELKNHSLRLVSQNGERCVIEYKSAKDLAADDFKKVTLSMVSPCDFIRGGRGALSYSYDGKFARDVVIVVGGPPDPKAADRFQPHGCSTQFQVVNFLEQSVRISDRFDGGPMCPSSGRDEVYFGYGYGLDNEDQ